MSSTYTIYVLDRLNTKPVKLTGQLPEGVKYGDRVVYQDSDGKEMVGTILGYPVDSAKTGVFLYPLIGQQADNFTAYQEKAAKLYETFKAKFAVLFPESVPLTARMNLQGNQVYFYFFAETRFDFAEFVKSFRQEIGYNFFLYQVGARDRVRLHPHLEERYDPSGQPLIYHIFKHPLPNVEGDVIGLQHLEWRDIDKLKDRSGKLDHSLNFEKDIYEEESKKFPYRGEVVSFEGKKMKCTGINILTEEIKLRGQSEDDPHEFRGEFRKITLTEYRAQLPVGAPAQGNRPPAWAPGARTFGHGGGQSRPGAAPAAPQTAVRQVRPVTPVVQPVSSTPVTTVPVTSTPAAPVIPVSPASPTSTPTQPTNP